MTDSSDLNPQNVATKKKSSTPIGAIVGGVVGGVGGLSILGLILFFIRRKKIQRRQAAPSKVVAALNPPMGYPEAHLPVQAMHTRLPSDGSFGIGYAYQKASRSFVTTPTSRNVTSPMSMRSRSESVNSLSYFGSVAHSNGIFNSPPPGVPGHSTTPSPPPPQMIQSMNPEDIIVPFSLGQEDSIRRDGSNTNLVDRKRADGAIIPMYDPLNSLPAHSFQLGGPSLDDSFSNSRPRFNPPAYSSSTAGRSFDESRKAPGGESRPAHSKNPSGDTAYSVGSNMSAESETNGPGNDVVSMIDDVIGRMGFHGTETVSGTAGTWATGQSMQLPRNQMFRPIVENPDP